jgi:uncharacterized membrane protein
MSWGVLFRIREYLKGSLWFFPLIGAILGPLVAVIVHQADVSVKLPAGWQYTPSTASTLLTTIVGATVGLTGFVVTVSVLAIQMATGTFSARYMRIWYRDPMLKAVLAVLAGTLTFSFSLLRRLNSAHVPNIGVTVAAAFVVLSLVLFFLDRFIRRLRPVAVAGLVGRAGRKVFTSLTEALKAETVPADTASADIAEHDPVLVVSSGRAGSIQAIDIRGLVAWASQHDRRLVLQSTVGDFVSRGEPLIEVFGGGPAPAAAGRRLRGMIALGLERTLEQDATFCIRVMVDVAIRALSAAINDPTTAVQVLDHLEDLLRLIGSAPLRGRLAFRDGSGTSRLVMPGRSWEDYLTLAVTEIREYGSGAIQVTRRLRAMLEDLRDAVRPEHRPAVEAELKRLGATVTAGFGGSVDHDRAEARDRQGIGGPAESRRTQDAASQTGSRQ